MCPVFANRGSYAVLCSVDFAKAFDKINYSKLFNMFPDVGISLETVPLLALSGCFSVLLLQKYYKTTWSL